MTTPDLSEADFQRQVIELAHLYGWHVMHVRKSIGRRGGAAAHQTTTSIKGWPDLTLFRPSTGEHFMAELKSEKGRLSADQKRTIADLRDSGLEVHVWRPSDWNDLQTWLSR